MIGAFKKDIELVRLLYIHYLICFKKNKIQTLINFNSKVNAMTPTYTAKLDLKIQKINADAQKIDGSIFHTFRIMLASDIF